MTAIFQISSFFPFPRGATFSAFRLAQSLRDRGVKVIWIVHDRDGSWKNGGYYEGFEIISFPFDSDRRISKWWGFLRVLGWYCNNRKEIDLCHFHGGGTMILFTMGCLRLILPRKPVVMKMTLDGWDTPDGLMERKHAWLLQKCFYSASALVAMTSGQHRKVEGPEFSGVCPVIPNGVDMEKYQPNPKAGQELRQKLGISEKSTVLAYLGTVGHRKGTDILLKLYKRLQEKNVPVVLLLIGDFIKDRSQEKYLKTFLNEAGLAAYILEDEHIIQTGPVEDAERYLQASDIFVFPSRQEGFGTVQIEAMACGLPCVVNYLPGVTEDIYPDASVGMVLKELDAKVWAGAIEKLINNPDRRARMGQAARQRVEEQFSIESVADRYLDLYGELLGKKLKC